jgi:hypothetical protein
MIAPDAASSLQAERRFDLLSAILIGVVAVLAAILAVVQIDTAQNASRAQQQAASLAADLSARIETSDLAQEQLLLLSQRSLIMAMQATARQIAGLTYEDPSAAEIANAETAASSKLAAALRDTAATSGGAPLDPYTSAMIKATTIDLLAEVKEQNRQVDLANAYSDRNTQSILGLSFLALAGVLTGLGAVLREGRAGWFALASAGAMAAAAGVMAALAIV